LRAAVLVRWVKVMDGVCRNWQRNGEVVKEMRWCGDGRIIVMVDDELNG
jgi:hypothetical protein